MDAPRATPPPTRAGHWATRCCVVAAVASVWLMAAVTGQSSPALVITNARIADLAAGRTRAVAAILVEGQKIVAVHQAAPATLPENATRIDAGGATLLPALTDLAVQATPGGALDADFHYAMSLAHGVMRLRVVDVRLPWGAQQRDRANTGEVPGPRLFTSGPPIDLRAPFGSRARPILGGGLSPLVQVGDAAGAAREVERQAAAGADWVRLGAQATPDVLRGVLTAARKARVRVSLTPWATAMSGAAAAGVTLLDGLGSPLKPAADAPLPAPNVADPHATSLAVSIDRQAALDEAWARATAADLKALVAQLARTRTPVAPALATMAARAGRDDVTSDLGWLPETSRPSAAARATPAAGPAAAQAFSQALAFVAALHKAGGTVGTASGANPDGWPLAGVGVHRELRWLVEAGLTPAEALRASAADSAEVLGARGAGQVRAGAPADFFAVKDDPLTDIGALAGITLIVRNGEVIERDALLAQARRAARR